MISRRIEQALQTLPRMRVAVPRPEHIDLIITVTRLAAAARNLGIPVVVVGADLALRPRIPDLALAEHVLRDEVQRAPVGERVPGLGAPGARTGPARDVHVQSRVSVVALAAAVAVRALRVVSAIVAYAGVRVAGVRVPVAVAPLAVGEPPEADAALVALAPVRVGPALALAAGRVAEVVQRADAVAVAGQAALRAEAVVAGGAPVAAPAHHVRLALAGPPVFLAQFAG